MDKRIYVPLVDEPSLFTEKLGKLNKDWVLFAKYFNVHQSLAADLERMRIASLGIKALFMQKEIMADQEFKKKLRADDPGLFINNMALVKAGCDVMRDIKKYLETNPQEDHFEQPSRVVTSSGVVSMRWVLHVARVDGMSPEEAYAYGKSLIK